METLSKIFGSEAKVKIMRLFLFNPETIFVTGQISEKTKEDMSKVRREVNLLSKTGLIKNKSIKGHQGYILNQQFVYLVPLQNFLINTEPLKPEEIVRRITRLGPVKLIITSGVFIQDKESRVDLLIVGDHIKKGALENTIKILEAEIGKELKYAYFTTEDFKYRLSMFDKLIRDILDYPHKKILNKIGIM